MEQGTDIVDNDSNPPDCHGHGTHVAGTAAGTSYGIAKKATVIGRSRAELPGSGTDDDLLAGINWVKANASQARSGQLQHRLPQPVHQPAMDNAVKSLIATGVQFVQAAGNSNDDACYYSPQLVPAAITVGNTTSSDARNSTSN